MTALFAGSSSKHLRDLIGGGRSQDCHGYVRACLRLPPVCWHLPNSHLLAMSLNVAKYNLGKVKREITLSSGFARLILWGSSGSSGAFAIVTTPLRSSIRAFDR